MEGNLCKKFEIHCLHSSHNQLWALMRKKTIHQVTID